ncbi:MAG: YgiQ family radical SAM protein [Spirochaetes bacterium]|nr:YgiQ family radical SAM protein [Spirochaetota bacterium]
MFIPATKEEMDALGWDRPDVVLVSGDAYIDSPLAGAAVIGRVLLDAGYRVGIIPQPRTEGPEDIGKLGEPRLFWGVTAGSVDSMVSNYNADRSRRRHDDFTPGGAAGKRPDRASIVYTNLIRRHFRNTVPVVLGGIEASLRRIAHYDYWDNAVRRSLLFDAKADLLVYGMGELAVLALAGALSRGEDPRDVPGICYIAGEAPPDRTVIPPFEEARDDPGKFTEMFLAFCGENGSRSPAGIAQRHGDRWLVQNPPQRPLTPEELDRVHLLPYRLEAHPSHRAGGKVTALDTIRFSLATHRGCFGGCNFCSIAVHQGNAVISRSEESVMEEARRMTSHPRFRGIIADVGGATANMYGMECGAGKGCGGRRRCLTPGPCTSLGASHERYLKLLGRLRDLPGVRKAFVTSGIRFDLVMQDGEYGRRFMEELLRHHLSGQLRIAPEHTVGRVLRLMGKPEGEDDLAGFIGLFNELNRKLGTRHRLAFYCMAAHPGCTEEDMGRLARDLGGAALRIPGQVQIFTPTPSTWSTLLYHTGMDPKTGEPVFVERDMGKKTRQKRIFSSGRRPR